MYEDKNRNKNRRSSLQIIGKARRIVIERQKIKMFPFFPIKISTMFYMWCVSLVNWLFTQQVRMFPSFKLPTWI